MEEKYRVIEETTEISGPKVPEAINKRRSRRKSIRAAK
jgi:hypothetical protein